jgi:hypothetical protein
MPLGSRRPKIRSCWQTRLSEREEIALRQVGYFLKSARLVLADEQPVRDEQQFCVWRGEYFVEFQALALSSPL